MPHTSCLPGAYSLWRRKSNNQKNKYYGVCLTIDNELVWGRKKKCCCWGLRSLAPTGVMSEVKDDTPLSAKCEKEAQRPTDRSSHPKSTRSSENWVRIIVPVSWVCGINKVACMHPSSWKYPMILSIWKVFTILNLSRKTAQNKRIWYT